MPKQDSDPQEVVALRINHVIPDPPDTKFANHMTVEHNEHEFIVSFFEIVSPIHLGDPESRRRFAESLGSIDAHLVARLAIAPTRMATFASAMQQNVAKYLQQQEEQNE